MKFQIGAGVECDLEQLVVSRLLVQANSGGGKSWLLRRLLEQSFGKVQHLVIDPEGEFASLRERFDYVLAAPHGGDTAAHPRTAKLLARRLLELNASAILDIYELERRERILFVRYFLEALIDAPKKLWHPALVVVDEAHVYAPQQGEAESANAVISLATRGRKRGFCAVLATQRLAKLHKDATAECNNKLIGRSIEIDAKRAADELGFSGRDAWMQMRDLEPGEFYAFGPALGRTIQKVRVGPIQTTHPEAGARMAFEPPAPTTKIKAMLPQLADLPAEAEQERKSLDELKRDNANLRREVTLAKKEAPPPSEDIIDRRVAAATAGLQREHATALRAASGYQDKLERVVKDVAGSLEGLAQRMKTAVNGKEPYDKTERQPGHSGVRSTRPGSGNAATPSHEVMHEPGERPAAPRRSERAYRESADGDGEGLTQLADLDAGARKMLLELAARHPLTWTQQQLGALCGYPSTKSTYRTYRSRLTSRGLITIADNDVSITEEGLLLVGDALPEAPTTHAAMMAMWRSKLDKGAYAMLEAAVAAGLDGLTEDEMAERAGYDLSTSTYRTYRSRLTSRALITIASGRVTATDVLFPEELP